MTNPRKLTHPDGKVWITDLDDDVREVRVTVFDAAMFVPKATCTTRYPDELNAQVLQLRGPALLCDEIRRWDLLKPGGVFFVNQTPNRYFPLEAHTT